MAAENGWHITNYSSLPLLDRTC